MEAGTTGVESARCSRCGFEGPHVEGKCGNPTCRCFVRFNSRSTVHNGRRLELGAFTPTEASEVQKLLASILKDLGDTDDEHDPRRVSVARRLLAERLAEVAPMAKACGAYIAARGPLTERGRRRAAVNLYFEAVACMSQLASKIGLERQGTQSPRTMDGLLKKAAETSHDYAGGAIGDPSEGEEGIVVTDRSAEARG